MVDLYVKAADHFLEVTTWLLCIAV